MRCKIFIVVFLFFLYCDISSGMSSGTNVYLNTHVSKSNFILGEDILITTTIETADSEFAGYILTTLRPPEGSFSFEDTYREINLDEFDQTNIIFSDEVTTDFTNGEYSYLVRLFDSNNIEVSSDIILFNIVDLPDSFLFDIKLDKKVILKICRTLI